VLDAFRTILARHLFSPMQGITAGEFLRILVRHHFDIDPHYWPRAMLVMLASLENSAIARFEEWRYGRQIEAMEVGPPLFILGHFRSGTTHLHNLLALDPQFTYPTVLQVVYPRTFLTAGAMLAPFMSLLMARRRPQDEMTVGPQFPAEDEFALCVETTLSPYVAWVFPRYSACYEKYLTFHEAPAEELARWKAAYIRFLKKLTLLTPRPLLMKSPPHTARIRILLEMFPQARFIHIHRHPYAVFASTRHLQQAGPPTWQLQWPAQDDLDDRILRTYTEMHDAYFADRHLIPNGQFCEVSFEDLEREPIRVIEGIYAELGLPGFGSMPVLIDRYLQSIVGYRKNRYAELPVPLRKRIASEWRRSFVAWGYQS